MAKWMSALVLGTLAAACLSACASKGFVRTRVKEVDTKVNGLTQTVEETQERTRKNEENIAAVDQRTQTAQGAADRAQQSASAADTAARTAGAKAGDVAARTDELEKASKRLVFTVVLSEDQGQFKFGKSRLPDEAKARLDDLVARLKAEPNGAFLEIEGHTDSIGPKEVNDRIGLERAEAVKRYLFEQHQIPLHKMNVISYGMDKPAAPNTTPEGRAQNRRVVIRVLA